MEKSDEMDPGIEPLQSDRDEVLGAMTAATDGGAAVRPAPAETPRLYTLLALTPVHLGTDKGQGSIDMPIARDPITRYPIAPSSAVGSRIKAARRQELLGSDSGGDLDPRFGTIEDVMEVAFGSDRTPAALGFTDARLLFLPVASARGTFAWCTCPEAMRQWLEDDMRFVSKPAYAAASAIRTELPEYIASTEVHTNSDAGIVGPRREVLIAEYSFVRHSQDIDALANFAAQCVFPGSDSAQRRFCRRIALLNDDIFSALARLHTDVRSHVRINEQSETVEHGPWWEERLPRQSILGGIAWCERDRIQEGEGEGITRLFASGDVVVQMGGGLKRGQGHVHLQFLDAAALGTAFVAAGVVESGQ